jgi:hypothetical protein
MGLVKVFEFEIWDGLKADIFKQSWKKKNWTQVLHKHKCAQQIHESKKETP